MVLLLRPGTAAEDGRERGAFVAVVVDVFVLARPAAAADEDEDRLLLVGLLSPLLDDDDADDDECRWLRLVVVVAGGGAGAKDLVRAKAAAKGVEAPVDSEDRVAEEFLRLAAAEMRVHSSSSAATPAGVIRTTTRRRGSRRCRCRCCWRVFASVEGTVTVTAMTKREG